MRRLLLALPLLVLIGCREEEGAVKLTVTYSGFRPGCVRVNARDATGVGETSFTEVAGKGAVNGGALTLAIFRAEGWGSELEVEALAFERPCPSAGPPVTRQSGTVSLGAEPLSELTLELRAQDSDGDGYVTEQGGGSDCDDEDPTRYPDAPELCDLKDNDCDDQMNEGLGVGDSCTTPGSCTGTRRCVPDGGVECNAPLPTLTRYSDADSDGYGAQDAGPALFCDPPASGYSLNNLDCGDDDPLRYPFAPERCNHQDDNCDGVDDIVALGVGSDCTPEGGCTGRRSCGVDGGVLCEALTLPTFHFPDDDRDTYGRADAGAVAICGDPPAEVSSRSGDCDDGNPFIRPDAAEICDAADNDCDGASEGAGVCPVATPSWATIGSLDPGSEDWNAVEVWGDGGVWIAGSSNHRVLRRPGNSSFDAILTTGCDSDWWSMWVDPVTGRAYLGSSQGALAIQDPGAAACSTPAFVDDDEVRGLIGFRIDGGVEIHGATRVDSNSGKVFLWDGGTAVQTVTTSVHSLFNIHGLSGGPLFAVGGSDSSPRIYRFDAATGQWQDENVQNTTTGGGRMEGIQVVHPKLAYAVGWNGTVMRWDGTTWTRLPFLNDTEQLRAVLAFGTNSVYAASRGGRVFRYNGSTWAEQVSSGSALYDIAGTSPEDIWIVGQAGRVLHWPQ